jgi:hypothetical protein
VDARRLASLDVIEGSSREPHGSTWIPADTISPEIGHAADAGEFGALPADRDKPTITMAEPFSRDARRLNRGVRSRSPRDPPTLLPVALGCRPQHRIPIEIIDCNFLLM